jgi:hypothetical protein
MLENKGTSMQKMLTNIMSRQIVPTKLKLLLIFSTVLLVSCDKPFPAKRMYETDTTNGVCGVYEISDFDRLLFTHVEDLPLGACNGTFGFSTEDTPKVLNWTRDAIQKAKECQ